MSYLKELVYSQDPEENTDVPANFHFQLWVRPQLVDHLNTWDGLANVFTWDDTQENIEGISDTFLRRTLNVPTLSNTTGYFEYTSQGTKGTLITETTGLNPTCCGFSYPDDPYYNFRTDLSPNDVPDFSQFRTASALAQGSYAADAPNPPSVKIDESGSPADYTGKWVVIDNVAKWEFDELPDQASTYCDANDANDHPCHKGELGDTSR